MVALIRLISVAVVLACLSNHSAVAETDRSLDTVLAKWEAATAKIKTLDAKVYCWRYDTFAFVSGREPQRRGRPPLLRRTDVPAVCKSRLAIGRPGTDCQK